MQKSVNSRKDKKPLNKEPHGVGGWLLLYCINLTVLIPILTANKLLRDLTEESDPARPTLLVVCSAMPIANGAMVGLLLWQMHPRAMVNVKIYLFTTLCTQLIFGGLTANGSVGKSTTTLQVAEAIISFAISWTYFKRSKRVKRTYYQSTSSKRSNRRRNKESKIVI